VAPAPPSLPNLNCPFLIFSASSIPLITMVADSKLLSPSIGRNRCFILRWRSVANPSRPPPTRPTGIDPQPSASDASPSAAEHRVDDGGPESQAEAPHAGERKPRKPLPAPPTEANKGIEGRKATPTLSATSGFARTTVAEHRVDGGGPESQAEAPHAGEKKPRMPTPAPPTEANKGIEGRRATPNLSATSRFARTTRRSCRNQTKAGAPIVTVTLPPSGRRQKTPVCAESGNRRSARRRAGL